MTDPTINELAGELAEFDVPEKADGRSAREERIIAGFEEIQRFVDKHGRAPQHGEGNDIFERRYAVRLDRLRRLEDCRAILAPLDRQGLLSGETNADTKKEEVIDDDELMTELADANVAGDIASLHHVRASAKKHAAEEIAQRKACEDFGKFAPIFNDVTTGLKDGRWISQPFRKDTNDSISVGDLFIVGGLIAYVAASQEGNTIKDGRYNPRLRVVFSNRTEGDLLLRSLSRALYPDGDQPIGRRVIKANTGFLFGDEPTGDDLTSGTIYVLRSKSDNPIVATNRDILHKIGVTGGRVENRIGNASLDPTYLMADVEIVATYVLYNINRMKMENLIRKVFAPAQLDIEIKDRFGNPVRPREWFLVPLFAVNEAVERIKDGTITNYVYDPKAARLVMAKA
jgi:hypothetical protein